MPKSRIGELDVLRFVFALEIVLHHFETGTFPFGAIGVEFFFILSGLLMARHAEKWSSSANGGGRALALVADETWVFLKGKFRTFYKYYLFAFVFNVIVRSIIVNHTAVETVIMRLLKSIPTITLSFMAFTGRDASFYVYTTWYLSAMLIAMFILYPFLLRNYRFAVKIIFPILTIFLLGYGYVTYTNNYIASIDTWIGWIYSGILRAVSEIALGATLYYVSTEVLHNEIMMKRARRPVTRALLTLAKVCCYGIVLIYAAKTIFGLQFARSFSMHALLFCGIGVFLSYCGLGWTIPDCGFTRYLGKISLPIYIFHKLLRATWLNVLGKEEVSVKYAWLMAVVCVVASVVLMYVTDFLALGIQKLRAKRKAALSE